MTEAASQGASRPQAAGRPEAGSLQRRLTVALVAIFVAVGAATGLIGYRDAHRAMDALLDAHLVQAARLIGARAAHEIEELDVEDLADGGPWSQAVTLRVWSTRGELLFASPAAPAAGFDTLADGLHDYRDARGRWRVFVLRDRDRGIVLQVAEDHAERERLARRIAIDAVLPLLLSIPVLALAVGWSVRRALEPLRAVSEQIASRGPLALEPLVVGEVPAEIGPLVARLDELLERIRRSLEQERSFASNAAHELRNPLAALRAQAEIARLAPHPADAATALAAVISACDRLARLVDQLLALARVEELGTATAEVELGALARQTLADLAPAALRAGAEISLDAAPGATVRGSSTLLEALLRNLVDNALRHGGTGVTVEVQVRREADGSVSLRVTDDGPGLGDEDIARLGERFERFDAATDSGSGLGLAIVTRIVRWHGAQLQFARGGSERGLVAEVRFPATAP